MLLESIDFYNSFDNYRNIIPDNSLYIINNIYKLINFIVNKILVSLSSDRDSEFLFKEIICYFFFYLIIFIILSLVLFINEELDTSLTEIFFETFFISWVFFYFPDFIIYGLKSINNKITYDASLIINFILPFIELLSNLIKITTVSIRINTNYISGHLLLTIFILIFEFTMNLFFFKTSFIFSIIISFIYLLEVIISILQLYVLLILLVLYIQESNF